MANGLYPSVELIHPSGSGWVTEAFLNYPPHAYRYPIVPMKLEMRANE